MNGKAENRERFQIQHLAGNPDFVTAGLTIYDDLLVYPLEDLMQRIDEAQEDPRRCARPPREVNLGASDSRPKGVRRASP